MAKMKSRQEFPPGGWLYTQPQIPNFRAPAGSFDTVVRAVIDLRKGNAAITSQNNLSTDYDVVSNEVDAFNAQRMISNGWNHFVIEGGPSTANFRRPQQRLAQAVVAAGSSVIRTLGGIKLLTDWLGDGGKPVDRPLAEQRASKCVSMQDGKPCPKNGDPNFIERLSAVAADEIRKTLEIKHEMQITTSHDANLHTCTACSCPLKLKVHTPLKLILKDTSPQVMERLHPQCWIRLEAK